MCAAYCPPMRRVMPVWLLMLFIAGLILMLPSCSKPDLPPPAVVPVKVAVPVPCEPVEVEATPLPAVEDPDSIWSLAKTALARLSITTGDNERLHAANANPCPEVAE